MQYNLKIDGNVHWLGTNDRRKKLFENLWPLPCGVSYNSYLIADDKSALVDTIEMGSDGNYLGRIGEILGDKPLDYLIINHMEPDHSGEIATIVHRWPQVEIIGNAKTFKMLGAYFGSLETRLKEVGDGDTLCLGSHTLKFVMTPMVHWPETMMTYETNNRILFSGDAFATFGALDGGIIDTQLRFEYYESEMRRYYSNIVGRYGAFVQKAIAKLADVPVKTICPLHGPVWQENVRKVIGLYDKWSRCEADDAVVVIYASMYGSTAQMADFIAHKIAENGIRDIRVYDVSKTHISFLISEIWRCKGVVLGSCAYNAGMFPAMEFLTRELEYYRVQNRKLAIFGTYTWSGGGVRNLRTFAEKTGWDMVCDPVEVLSRLDYTHSEALAKSMADALK